MNKELEALKSIKETIISSSRSDWETEYYYLSGIQSTKKHFDIIEAALKRNIPMKPIKYKFGGFQCPACGGLNCQSYNSDLSERNLNFCDDCGRALDWSNQK